MIPRTPGAAIQWIKTHRTWEASHCLQYVRSAYGIPSKYPSAISAWTNAQHRHENDYYPPVGAPVFFKGGRYGHIAYSAGGGTCWSTDAVTRGHVDKVNIAELAVKWNYPCLGWTEDLNGVKVWEKPWIDLSGVIAAAKVNGKAHNGHLIKQALAAEVGKGMMNVHDDRLGRRFRRRYKLWQQHLGYKGKQADGRPGPRSLTRLAEKHGLDVRP